MVKDYTQQLDLKTSNVKGYPVSILQKRDVRYNKCVYHLKQSVGRTCMRCNLQV